MKADNEKVLPGAVPKGPANDFLPDMRQIAETVVELNILRKNVQIYPPGHDQVQRSLARAHQRLVKSLAVNPALTLGIAKDALMIGEAVLDPGNAVFREFAAAMKLHDIAAVTFQRGVNAEELIRFLGLISKLPKEVRDCGGIERALSELSLQHVLLRTVDYSQFLLTEEIEASKVPEDRAGDTDQIWQDFISHFVSGTLSRSEQDISIEDLKSYSPIKLAMALNSGQLKNVTAPDAFDRIVSRYLQYATACKGPVDETQGAFSNMNLLLQELSPELRRQFLSVAFDRCSPKSHLPEVETFLSGMSQNFVIEMLLRASEEGKEISPSLLNLIRKITNIDGIETGGLGRPSREKIEQLFKREDHETFVVPEYDALLQQIAGASRMEPDAVFPMEEFLETIKSPHLDIQIARVVITFLEEDISAEEYEEYTGQLMGTLPELIASAAFQILLVIFETFARHQSEKPNPGIRATAEAALKRMRSPDLVTRAVQVFDRRKTPGDDDGHAFLLAVGAEIVPDAVSILAGREVAVENDRLYRLLGHFRGETVSEINKRLKDKRTRVLNNMILLVRALSAKEATDLLRPFLDHPDSIVRLQALNTFLDFKDPEALHHLRREIQSNRADIVSQAIDWAGQYGIKEMVPDLLSKMKRVVLFRSDLHANEKVIRALGMIGDPESLGPLVKRVDGSFTLFRRRLVRMRRALFESLAGYPDSAIMPLVVSGNRSRDKEIRAICKKMQKKIEATADTKFTPGSIRSRGSHVSTR